MRATQAAFALLAIACLVLALLIAIETGAVGWGVLWGALIGLNLAFLIDAVRSPR